ncbi:hypothetical protein OGAPHI_002678 [Ogataea philodendri]|uniref:Uncharacterized protein n=1 Tax=Ogataea philodendri TaxID=1378263 RepID=A0A9P8PB32_9ASCO|nr:uncharacterized protein OGAPHI_002678 [Ogataea philodendri]KAH3668923.1 hypothetical protein OGAPHI_002678 [Ogataea philodendri]
MGSSWDRKAHRCIVFGAPLVVEEYAVFVLRPKVASSFSSILPAPSWDKASSSLAIISGSSTRDTDSLAPPLTLSTETFAGAPGLANSKLLLNGLLEDPVGET